MFNATKFTALFVLILLQGDNTSVFLDISDIKKLTSPRTVCPELKPFKLKRRQPMITPTDMEVVLNESIGESTSFSGMLHDSQIWPDVEWTLPEPPSKPAKSQAKTKKVK